MKLDRGTLATVELGAVLVMLRHGKLRRGVAYEVASKVSREGIMVVVQRVKR